MSLAGPDREVLARIAVGVAASTLLLTASFVGLVALLTGEARGLGARLPAYVLVLAASFVASVVLLELRQREGRAVLVAAGSVAGAAFVVLGLAGEGIVYALRNPDAVVASNLFFYLVSAGLIATGLGYWGARHWREVADSARL